MDFINLLSININLLFIFKAVCTVSYHNGNYCAFIRWLCCEMLNKLNWQQDIQIAELGAGTGVITQQILKRMSSNSVLDVFEI